MESTFKTVAVKFIMTIAFAGIAFVLLEGNTWGWVFLVGVIATIINYAVGDLMILPRYDKIPAAIADGIIALLVAVILSLLTPVFVISAVSVILFGILVTAGEYFFHEYLKVNYKIFES